MEENKEKNNKEVWWKAGVEMFTQVSVWIVWPIVLALIVGKRLDAHYGTKPLIFLAFSGFGFLISSLGIVWIVMKYMKKMEKETKDAKEILEKKDLN